MTAHSGLLWDLLSDGGPLLRYLLLGTSPWSGSLPFSIFTALTKLCCVLIVCNRPNDYALSIGCVSYISNPVFFQPLRLGPATRCLCLDVLASLYCIMWKFLLCYLVHIHSLNVHNKFYILWHLNVLLFILFEAFYPEFCLSDIKIFNVYIFLVCFFCPSFHFNLSESFCRRCI